VSQLAGLAKLCLDAQTLQARLRDEASETVSNVFLARLLLAPVNCGCGSTHNRWTTRRVAARAAILSDVPPGTFAARRYSFIQGNHDDDDEQLRGSCTRFNAKGRRERRSGTRMPRLFPGNTAAAGNRRRRAGSGKQYEHRRRCDQRRGGGGEHSENADQKRR